jgi:hypothetical protein
MSIYDHIDYEDVLGGLALEAESDGIDVPDDSEYVDWEIFLIKKGMELALTIGK